MEHPDPRNHMMQLINGKCVTKAIGVAAEHAIADRLHAGARDVDSLASETETNSDALYRLLRFLSSIGVFEELPGRTFQNNKLSDTLRRNAPGSIRNWACWFSNDLHWRIWGEFDHSVRTGETGIQKLFPGEDAFQMLRRHPEAQQLFQDTMTELTMSTGRAVVEAYDFSPFGRIVDVGGGFGGLAAMIKQAAPNAEVVLFDLPHVIDEAQRILNAHGQANVKFEAGSFIDGVPGPADAYVMKAIIHDWPDDVCIKILGHCRENLSVGGKVLICDAVVAPGPQNIPVKALDLEMLVGPGGRERTESEFASLLERAGLKLARVFPTKSMVAVIEATRQ